MTCAQTSSLSLTEGRLLEGEMRLAYWCMSAILHSLFLFFLFFFLRFVTLILSPTPLLSFLVLTCVVLW